MDAGTDKAIDPSSSKGLSVECSVGCTEEHTRDEGFARWIVSCPCVHVSLSTSTKICLGLDGVDAEAARLLVTLLGTAE